MKMVVNHFLPILLASSFSFSLIAKENHDHHGKMHDENQTVDFDKKMSEIFDEYLIIHKSLTNDSTEKTADTAKIVEKKSEELKKAAKSGHIKELAENIKITAKEISVAKNIKDSRQGFEKLSKSLAMWVSMSKPAGVFVMYCPMVKANWLQKSMTIQNPYGGKEMLSCGEVVDPKKS